MAKQTLQIPTTVGIIAPARSLTDSVILPQGCLMKANNCTFLPNGNLSLWRPKLVEVNCLVEDTDETVVSASYDCGVLCFISRIADTYKFYAYRLSTVSTPLSVSSPAPVETVLQSEEGLTACCVIGTWAVFTVEGNPPFYYDIKKGTGWYGGSICWTKASSADYIELDIEGDDEYLLTQLRVTRKTKLSKVRLFFGRSMPDLYGKAYLKFYVNGEYRTRSIELLYIGALPDFNTYNPVESTQFLPVEFELGENLLLEADDIVDVRLYVDN